MPTIAVLLAGGTGRRFGADRPKQLLTVAGKTVLEHTLTAFIAAPDIDEVAVVIHPDWHDEVAGLLRRYAAQKALKLLHGGAERSDSTLAALRAYGDVADCRLVFHDAVRAGVSQLLIGRVCAALRHHRAVNTVLPAVDTMIEVDSEGHTVAVPDRRRLRRVQTPQGFHAGVLREAYHRALADPDFQGTDDCGVVFRYCPEVDIALVEGEERNFKLTWPDDLALLHHFLTDSPSEPC